MSKRPASFYLYGPVDQLAETLETGRFALSPWPATDVALAPQAGRFLTLSFSTVYKDSAYDRYPGANACLCILRTEEFGERIHRAVERALPNWAGIDAAITYGSASPLGASFSRPLEQAPALEWQFAWRPMQTNAVVQTHSVSIGNIEHLAQIRVRQ